MPRQGQPPSALGTGIRALPGGSTNQSRPRRARWPEVWTTHHHPCPPLCPYSSLPSPLAAPSAAGSPLKGSHPTVLPFSRDTQFQSPTNGILVYIPVTEATKGHKALNYLGHMTPHGRFPLPSPQIRTLGDSVGSEHPIPQPPRDCVFMSAPQHFPTLKKGSRLWRKFSV